MDVSPSPRPQLSSFSQLWGATIADYRQHASVYLPISLVSVIGTIAISIVTAVSPDFLTGIVLLVVGALVNIVLNVLAGLALQYAVINPQEAPTLADAFRKSQPFLGKWIVTNILVGLIIIGGFILFVIPGIIWGITYAFASYVVIREGITGGAALRRSKELTKGRWFDVFWRNLVLFAIVAAISLIAGAIVGAITGGAEPVDSIVGALVTMVITPIGVIFLHYLYETLHQTQTIVVQPEVPAAPPIL